MYSTVTYNGVREVKQSKLNWMKGIIDAKSLYIIQYCTSERLTQPYPSGRTPYMWISQLSAHRVDSSNTVQVLISVRHLEWQNLLWECFEAFLNTYKFGLLWSL